MKLSKISFVYLMFFLALFFPTRFFDFYHMSLIGMLVVLIGFYGFEIKKESGLGYIFVFLFLIVVSIFLGTLFYQTNPLRNMTELIRYIPLIILFFSLRTIKPDLFLRCINNVFLTYSFLCLIVSLLQVNSIALVDFITNLYGSDHQIEFSLGISSRALGFSSGPGQNGTIMAVIFSFSLGQFLIKDKNIVSIITAFSSFFVVVLSQSQTAFIVVSLVSLYSLIYMFFFLNKKYKLKSFRYLLIIFPVVVFLLVYFKDNLKYLFTLFSHGLGRSSYQARVVKNEYLYNLTTDNLFALFFGHGKDYFGAVAGHMDNEYIFYFGVYGVLASMIIIFFYISVLLRPYFQGLGFIKNSNFDFSLHLIVFVGVVLAWPSAFILDPRVLFIVSFLYVVAKRERCFNIDKGRAIIYEYNNKK